MLGCSLGGFNALVPGSRRGPSGLLPKQGPLGPPCASGRQLRKEKSIYILAGETAALLSFSVAIFIENSSHFCHCKLEMGLFHSASYA